MKILLLGNTTGYLDEGMKNITHNLRRVLAKFHEVKVIHPRQAINLETLRSIHLFNPDIIHYMQGPTIRSFLLVKLLSVLNPDAATVISAPRPSISKIHHWFLSALKVDLILLQSKRYKDVFKKLALYVEFFYPGIDAEKFRPVPSSTKNSLRLKYNLPKDKYIVLHVGQVTSVRNVNTLGQIQKKRHKDVQVLIVAASTIKPDQRIVRRLKNCGCIIREGYHEELQEIFQLADCYIFPGIKRTPAIEVPLTILEAAACNLPIICGYFGGLPDIFKEEDGFFFVKSEVEIRQKLDLLMENGSIDIKNREKINKFTWFKVSARLMKLYEECLKIHRLRRQKRLPRLICFIGVDGSGKTAIAKQLTHSPIAGVRYNYVWGSAQPIFMRPLRKLVHTIILNKVDMFKDYQEYDKTKKRVAKRFLIFSKFYSFIFVIDYFLWMLFCVRIPLALGKNIICDRYIFDMAINIHFLYANLFYNVDDTIKFFLKIFPTPEMVYLIDLPEEIAFSRKDDIPSIEYLRQRRIVYREVAKRYGAKIIEGTKPLRVLADIVRNDIIKTYMR